MDASFLRFLIEEARGLLEGARIENIYNPAPSLWTFKLSSRTNLIFFFGRRDNFIFFSTFPPENPPTPSNAAMWWRKRVKNSFIKELTNLWPRRKIFLSISRENLQIILDLKDGLYLREEEDICDFNMIQWPPLSEIEEKQDIYRSYPHISSVLRYDLISISSRKERQRWYSRLIEGDIDKFFLYEGEDRAFLRISLWPRDDLKKGGAKEEVFSSALEVAEEYGLRWLKSFFSLKGERGDRRRRRAIKRIEREMERAKEMIEQGEKAQLIHGFLYKFSPSGHYKYLEVEDKNGNPVRVSLNPSLTLVENMELMFKRARKGKRVLLSLERRWKEINERQQQGKTWILQDTEVIPSQVSDRSGGLLPRRFRGLKLKTFLSSDGYIMVRGKNQEANHRLVTRASRPHDLWFHVEGGPGAHIVVIRDNPREEIPLSTRLEAAQLAALASYERCSSTARVLCSEIRYVKHSRYKPRGEMDVIKVIETLVVRPDPSLEGKLKVEQERDK